MTGSHPPTAPAAVADPPHRGPAASLTAQTDRILACIHCGFCLDACPTYTRGGDESDSPRGRIYLMRAVAEGRLAPDSEAFATHLDRCLGCRACEPVCPSGVEYGFLLERGREAIARATGISFLERILLATFASPVLNAIAGFMARTVRATGMAALAVRLVPKRFRRLRMAAAMLEASRPLPRMNASWTARPAVSPAEAAANTQAGAHPDPVSAAPPARKRTAVFQGCVQKTLFGRVNAATKAVLKANGHTVVGIDGLRCCGALHAHAGDLEGARKLARLNLAVLGPAVSGETGKAVDAIIVNAAGCGAMMKDYAKLFEGRPEEAMAAEVAGRVRDPLVFLAETGVRPVEDVAVRAAWDSPCHLIHGQRAGDTPLDLARRALPGADIVPLPGASECCGGAGIHALVHGGYSDRVLADKLAAVESVGPEVVLSANPGCIMQIGGGSVLSGRPVRVMHPVELIASGADH